MERVITKILNNLGLKTNTKGYRYIRESLSLILRNKYRHLSTTKDIYGTIALRHQEKPTNVERAIRYSIETMMNKGNFEYIFELFTLDRNKCKPSNSEFLYTITNYIEINKNKIV